MSAPGPRRRNARRQARTARGTTAPPVQLFHVAPRSVLALAPALVPAIELDPPDVPRLRRSPVSRRLVALVAVGLVVGAAAIAFAGTRVVLARFTDAAAVAPNTFATGTWAATSSLTPRTHALLLRAPTRS